MKRISLIALILEHMGSPLSREWRYRVGDYRIIAIIQDDELIILVVAIGHRRDINETR